MITLVYLSAGIVGLIVTIIVVVKIIQIADDLRYIRNFIEDIKPSKNERVKAVRTESKPEDDLNNPEVLNSLLNKFKNDGE